MNTSDTTDLVKIQALRPGSLVNGVYTGPEIEIAGMPERLRETLGPIRERNWMSLLLPSVIWECLELSVDSDPEIGAAFRACLHGKGGEDEVASIEALERNNLIEAVLSLWDVYLGTTCTLEMARKKWWPMATLCLARLFEVVQSKDNTERPLWALALSSEDGDPPLIVTLAEAWEEFKPVIDSSCVPEEALCPGVEQAPCYTEKETLLWEAEQKSETRCVPYLLALATAMMVASLGRESAKHIQRRRQMIWPEDQSLGPTSWTRSFVIILRYALFMEHLRSQRIHPAPFGREPR